MFALVVPNANEIAGVLPPVDCTGYVPVTEVTPPEEVVVAIIFPVGSTASTVPAAVARLVSQVLPLTVKRDVEAFVNVCRPAHVFDVVVPNANARVPVIVIGPPVIG